MDQNPYAAPQASTEMAANNVAAGASGPQPWEIGEVLSQSWGLFKQHWAILLGSLVVGYLVMLAPSQIVQVILASSMGGGDATTGLVAGAVVGMLVQVAVQSYIQIGWSRIWLACVRGETPTFGLLFSGADRYLTALGATFLMILGIYLGFILLIVPGLILAMGLSLTLFFVADTKLGAVDCLKASWEATKGQRLPLFGFFLVAGLVAALGLVACGVGILATANVFFLATAIVFTRVSGRLGASEADREHAISPA